MTQKLFKADHVGSFLRPQELKVAREDFEKGEINVEQLKAVEYAEIIKLVKKQIDAGLKTITDGEFQRTWWHQDFFWGLNGFEKVRGGEIYQFSDDTKTKPENFAVVGKVSGENHPFVEHFKTLKSIVDEFGDGTQIVKFTIPAAGNIIYREYLEGEKEFYPSAKELLEDLGKAYNQVVRDLYEAGCRFLQVDDVSLAVFKDPKFETPVLEANNVTRDELFQGMVDAINATFVDKPEDLIAGTHICRGNFQSKHAHSDGDYDFVAKVFPELAYDLFFLEYDTDRSGGFEPLKYLQGTDKVAVIGIVTSKFPELEDVDLIKGRIKEATQYLPLEQLALSPQCGFASTEEGNVLTEEEQWAKVRHVVNIANQVW